MTVPDFLTNFGDYLIPSRIRGLSLCQKEFIMRLLRLK